MSKPNFLIYLEWAHNAWVKMHRPEVNRAKPLSAFEQNIIETSNKVDDLAICFPVVWRLREMILRKRRD